MIIATKTYTEGRDIILSSLPVVNVIALTGITEDIISGTGSFTNKSYRYTVDGINWSIWMDQSTLLLETFNESDLIVVESKYTKDNPDSTIDINSFTLSVTDGSYTPTIQQYNETSFKNFFEMFDTNVLGWLVNVLQKLYDRGHLVIPNYLERLDENESNEHFIEVWRPIIHYFAYYVIFARKYQEFYNTPFLLEEYLLQRGLYLSLRDIEDIINTIPTGYGVVPTVTLGNIDMNLPQQPAGTVYRFVIDGREITSATSVISSHGISEITLAINNLNDFSATSNHIGAGLWQIVVTGPTNTDNLYGGVEAKITHPGGDLSGVFSGGSWTADAEVFNSGLYLMWTFYSQMKNRGTDSIVKKHQLLTADLTNWRFVDGELLRLVHYKKSDELVYNHHKTEHFGWNLGNSSPLYRGVSINDSTNKIVGVGDRVHVNPTIAYELTFQIQDEPELKIEVWYRNQNGSRVDLLNHSDSTPLNIPLDIDLYRTDKPTFVRVQFLPIDRAPNANDTTNLNQGNNLRFQLSGANGTFNGSYDQLWSLIGPGTGRYTLEFRVTNNSGNDISGSLTDVRFGPMFTHYSHGIIQVPHWISCWLVNNNESMMVHELRRYIRQYLINYNSHLELVTAKYNGEGEDDYTPVTPTYAWRGVDAECYEWTEVWELEWVGDDVECEQTETVYRWVGDENTAECITEDEQPETYWTGEEETATCEQF